ncbi:MAG: hypothetical protein HFI82_13285 [Eubacterium sp.]|jgi:hypothetical protein|nr:hypothetical protein [Eubacterium sp.]
MAEKKLSDKLRQCLEGKTCGECPYYEKKTKVTCSGLLQKAYEVVKRYEEIVDKLAEYENIEEQGKLLKLPCAVGDKVYAHCSMFGILEYEVDNIAISKTITYQCSSYSKPVGDCPSECLDEIELDISDFGKDVFLTKEAAEKALKEMEDRKNG